MVMAFFALAGRCQLSSVRGQQGQNQKAVNPEGGEGIKMGQLCPCIRIEVPNL